MITDTTLSNIADAIRAKTGKADMITPEQMPTEIGGISVGVDVTLIDNIDIVPNFANGDQIVMAQEGYAVKGATILKPATLIPENIAEGVEIAGVVGTHAGGGGSSADVRYVTFVSGDTVLYKKPVATGDDCVDVYQKGLIDKPTKESTAAEDYTFSSGWSATPGGAADANILKNITEDKTVYAVFTATARLYTITWLDEDGVTELPGQKQWAYGTVPSYAPVKDGYNFDGWTPTPVEVTGDATYTASWSEMLSGSCGESAYWELSGGVLTISGTGELAEQASDSGYPWYKHRTAISAIVVQEGITRIPNFAFGNTNAVSVQLPNTITEIDMCAFWSSPLLESIVIPDSCITAGSQCFQGCSKLSSVTLGKGLTTIGSRMFYQCSALTSITIPSQVTTIGSAAFQITGLTSAYFEVTTGWTCHKSTATTISPSVLAKPSDAATYLRYDGFGKYKWTRS